MTAGDAFGMHFLFWFPAWGFTGKGEPTCVSGAGAAIPWQNEVLNYRSPGTPATLAEVKSTGAVACVLRADYLSMWEKQNHRDIYEMFKNYGSHASFAGFYQDYEFSIGYSSYTGTGYSNQTIANFTSTKYYQNMTKYSPYYSLDKFTGGSAGFWSGSGGGLTTFSTGITTTYTYNGANGVSNGFYGSQNSSTTMPVTLEWAPLNGISWKTTSISNETLWFWPSDTNHATSMVSVKFTFSFGGATETYTVTPSIVWNAWNKVNVDWWKSYLSTHSGDSYNKLVSIDVSLTSSAAVTSKLVIANAYTFQADWLGRTVDTITKANDIINFEQAPHTTTNNAVVGNNLPTGTSLPVELLGDFGGYKAFVLQEIMNDAVTYCQTLVPKCITMADAVAGDGTGAAPSNTGFTDFNSFGMRGGASANSWPATYGANVEGTICSASFNCGIGRGLATNNYGVTYGNPFVGNGAVGWGCSSSNGGVSYTCNNENYNTVQAIPYELSGAFPNAITPTIGLQSNPESLVSNFTLDVSHVPANTGATAGKDFAYNQRAFARIANNIVYQREPGYSANALAKILYVNSNPWDSSAATTNFLTPQFLQSVGFNVTTVTVTNVKHQTLSNYNAIIWTSPDQPNETNQTTYNNIVDAINNHGVGLIVVGGAGAGYNGGVGVTASQFTKRISASAASLTGVAFPFKGSSCFKFDCGNTDYYASSLYVNTGSSVMKAIMKPYTTLSLSDIDPVLSPTKMMLENTTTNFATDAGTVLMRANSSGGFPVMTEINGTGVASPPGGAGAVFWIGTTLDTSGLYGSYVSTGLFTKQVSLYLNTVLYAANKKSTIPYIYTNPSEPTYYRGVTMSMLGLNNGKQVIWFSDYTHTSGGTATISTNYKFNGVALGIGTNWVALNLDTMGMVNKSAATSTVMLPLTLKNETWTPVCVANFPSSNFNSIYSSSTVKATHVFSNHGWYTLTGPPGASSWLVTRDDSSPTIVSSNVTGVIANYNSLSSLNVAINATWSLTNQYQWQPTEGWFYDSTNKVLAVAFRQGSTANITISNAVLPTSYSITFSANGPGTTSPSGTQSEVSTVPFGISATPNSGNIFNGWTSTAGITINDINTASTTAIATQNGTITASFVSSGSPNPGGGGLLSSTTTSTLQIKPIGPTIPPALIVVALLLVGIIVFGARQEKRGSV